MIVERASAWHAHGQNHSVIGFNANQFGGTVERLMQKVSTNPDGASSGCPLCWPDVFGSQRKQRRTVGKFGFPRHRSATDCAGLYFALQQIGVADELGHIRGRRTGLDLARCGDLLQFSGSQQRDAVRHHHGFFLIVGDEYEGGSYLTLKGFQFHLHLPAQICVQRR